MSTAVGPKPRVWRVRPGVWTTQCPCGWGCTVAEVPHRRHPQQEAVTVASSHAVSHLADDAETVPWWWSAQQLGKIVLDEDPS